MEKKEKVKILVVDDQSNWRKLLSVILAEYGFEVTTAKDISEVDNYIKTEKFDVATIDMRLVDTSSYNVQGLEVLKKVKKLQPSIKTIILTGYPDENQKNRAMNYYKADQYYEKVPDGKPFEIDGFISIINELIS